MREGKWEDDGENGRVVVGLLVKCGVFVWGWWVGGLGFVMLCNKFTWEDQIHNSIQLRK